MLSTMSMLAMKPYDGRWPGVGGDGDNYIYIYCRLLTNKLRPYRPIPFFFIFSNRFSE